MVEMNVVYEGQLRCKATHGPSKMVISTDAPKDNQGKGDSFSPTDLVATALGACMMTIMGIYAQRQNIDLTGSTVRVTKEMVTAPVRRIGKLTVQFDIKGKIDADHRKAFENAAHTCPVHKSLHPDVLVETTFNWA